LFESKTYFNFQIISF